MPEQPEDSPANDAPPLEAIPSSEPSVEDLSESSAEEDSLELPKIVTGLCWRCGKSFEATMPVCPHCLAKSNPSVRALDSESEPPAESPLTRVLVAFFVFLMTSLVCGLANAVQDHDLKITNQDPSRNLSRITFVEILDTILILFALSYIPKPPPVSSPSTHPRLMGTCFAIPILVVLLVINVSYHFLLRALAGLTEFDSLGSSSGEYPLWSVIVICIQPAIVEEIFFRYLALGTLCTVCRTSTALFISSLMFGIAHIGVPLSIPILCVIGLGLGFLRVYSGTIWLPMLVHFAHNAILTFFGGYL